MESSEMTLYLDFRILKLAFAERSIVICIDLKQTSETNSNTVPSSAETFRYRVFQRHLDGVPQQRKGDNFVKYEWKYIFIRLLVRTRVVFLSSLAAACFSRHNTQLNEDAVRAHHDSDCILSLWLFRNRRAGW